jgi:hypothetical protein
MAFTKKKPLMSKIALIDDDIGFKPTVKGKPNYKHLIFNIDLYNQKNSLFCIDCVQNKNSTDKVSKQTKKKQHYLLEQV